MSEQKKPIYVLCPRCELNYIEEKDQYCNVCKAELGLVDKSILIPDDEEMETEKLCPVCKMNYLNDDEEVCFLCQKHRDAKDIEPEDDESWMNYSEEEDKPQDDEMEISLELVADEEEEEEEEESLYKEPDDFNYDVDPNDYIDDEEDEEDLSLEA